MGSQLPSPIALDTESHHGLWGPWSGFPTCQGRDVSGEALMRAGRPPPVSYTAVNEKPFGSPAPSCCSRFGFSSLALDQEHFQTFPRALRRSRSWVSDAPVCIQGCIPGGVRNRGFLPAPPAAPDLSSRAARARW